jgi:hypothetical protein
VDPRQTWQALQEHLSSARALLNAGDRVRALEAVDAALAIDPEFLAAHALRERILSPATRSADRPPAGRPAAPPAPTVSPDGYRAFEERTRRRRVDRQLDTARAALDRGRARDAAEALNEIVALDPDAPDLPELEQRLARLRAAASGFQHVRLMAAAAVVALAAAAAIYFNARAALRLTIPQTTTVARSDAPEPEPIDNLSTPALAATGGASSSLDAQPALISGPVVEPVSALSGALTDSQPSDQPAPLRRPGTLADTPGMPADPAPAIAAPAPGRIAATPPPASSPVTSPSAAPPPVTSPAAAPPRVTASAAASLPASAPSVASSSLSPSAGMSMPTPPSTSASLAPAPSAAASLPTAPSPSAAASVAVTPSPRVPPAATPPAIVPAVVEAERAPTVDEKTLVTQVLQRYRSAYERLDAHLAQAVWPEVNAAALARAFDGLQSQSLTFDACDVELRGDRAAATCRGSARYVPKVGRPEARVEPRVWSFDLRRTGTDWKIQTARAER